jgi:hypothetical protein
MISRLVVRDETRYKQKSIASNSRIPEHKSWIDFSQMLLRTRVPLLNSVFQIRVQIWWDRKPLTTYNWKSFNHDRKKIIQQADVKKQNTKKFRNMRPNSLLRNYLNLVAPQIKDHVERAKGIDLVENQYKLSELEKVASRRDETRNAPRFSRPQILCLRKSL